MHNPLLHSLILDNNNLTELKLDNCSLPSLSLVMVAENRLVSLDFRMLHQVFPNLTRIFAWGNQLTQVNLPNGWGSLSELRCNSNRISDVALLGDYPSLVEIELAYNDIQGIDLGNLRAITLSTINLSFNPLVSIILPKREEIPAIKFIDLLETNLKEIDLSQYASQEKIIVSRCSFAGITFNLVRIDKLQLQLPIDTRIIE